MYLCCLFLKMKDDKTNEIHDFYERLKTELNNSNQWPSEYLFKFIVPSKPENIEKVENAFNDMGAVIKTTKSKTGKFTSISIDVMAENAEIIIKKYQEVGVIEGIISL